MAAVQPPSPLAPIIDTNTGRPNQIFREYLQGLDGLRPVSVGGLPEPINGYTCFVIDTIDGGRPCYADGTNWRRFDNNAVVA